MSVQIQEDLDRLKSIRSFVNKQLVQRDVLRSELESVNAKLKDNTELLHRIERAQTIIKTVAKITQQELEFHLSELVSLAMCSVFDDPYELQVEFVVRRDRTEADIWFVKDGERIDPMSSTGGGAVDVAAFALNVALWTLLPRKSRPTFIQDEPLKWLKGGDLPVNGALMMSEISKRVGLQIIMVSHIPDQIEHADHEIRVMQKNGISQVKEVQRA